MKSIGKGLLERKEFKQANRIVYIFINFLVAILLLVSAFQTLMVTTAAPVITENDWNDTFDDLDGLSSSYNVNISNGDIKLDGYRNNFEDEVLGQMPANWLKEISGGSGNRFMIVDHYYEPGQAIWIRVNDDGSAFNQQKVYIEITNYFRIIEFELTLHAISSNTNRQGYFYIELFNNTDAEYHEVRYYWDDARSGTPSSSSSLTAIDLGYTLATGTSLGIKYFINENVSEDIDANPNVDLSATLGNISKVRYGFYCDAGPGWNHWEQVVIDNMGFYNDNTGNVKSIKLTLPSGYAWTRLFLLKTEPDVNCIINISILDGETDFLVPGFDDIFLSSLDISSIDPITYPTLKLYANLDGTGNATPILHNWTVLWEDIFPPETPSGLALSNPFTGYSLIISWDSNTESDLSHYRIYSSIDNSVFTWLADVPAGSVSYIHYGLTTGQTYYYKIAAVDNSGNPSSNTSVIYDIVDIDTDGDQIGNLVDNDDDGDTVPDSDDEFPLIDNEWIDTDSDGIGDNADYDDDNDGYDDTIDEFPLNITEWNDLDNDGIGDNTDSDRDGDGIANIDDEFPENLNEWVDTDSDSIGNNADLDDDGDGYYDVDDAFPLNSSEWLDTDGDGIGNNLDKDDDNDGYNDTIEITEDSDPLNPASHPSDLDYDLIPDSMDPDIDGDGVTNLEDDFPFDPFEWEDTDGDGLGDNKDIDIDNDGIINLNDVFPYNNTEWNDLDGDETGDNSDSDRDGDGIVNENDAFPNNKLDWRDSDSDGVGDNADIDDDDDGYPDINDAFPYNSTEWSDLDSDGIGDNSDSDKDGDGVGNDADLFPTISLEWVDFDSDGIGDNSDLDDDNDKHPDINDDYPYDSSRWQKPNELLPFLYLIILLLVVVIIIGIVILVKSRKGIQQLPKQQFFDIQNQNLSQMESFPDETPKEQMEEEKDELPNLQEMESEKKENKIIEPENENLQPPPPPPPPPQ